MEKVTIHDSVSILPGVGPARAAQLKELGIVTIENLLYHVPFRYETVEKSVLIAELNPDMTACFKAQVINKFPIRSARFKSMLKVRVGDGTGTIDLTWFNTPFMLSSLTVGQTYYFTGKVSTFKNKLTLTNPTVERQIPEFGSLIPIYHESSQIHSRFLRKLIKETLELVSLEDSPTMATVSDRHHLMAIKNALATLHCSPGDDLEMLSAARKRLAFDEMFTLIVGVLGRKAEHQRSRSTAKLTATNNDIQLFSHMLPYALTPSQKEAIQSISLDLVQPHPMHRLLQGEVGSGKTTVAAFALWIAATQNPPALLICPTNILAQQHYETLRRILGKSMRVGLYTGKEKNNDADILVGTHALFTVKGLAPSLVVVDEEHRFGVKQRETFFKKKKKPHFLSMTATPIPRTVALTALADQDVSYILPHKKNDNIKTWVVPHAKRIDAYTWMNETLKKTHGQAFIVCPFIEESLIDTLATVKSAKKEFETLQHIFPQQKLALLHGKISSEEKNHVFAHMMEGKTTVLVTTPVVEVGVDIPAANIIVIEGAERYGLAALHQLRGRVGRRGQDAFCLLFTSNDTDGTKRLEHFAGTYDGNALAAYDLTHRGSGELLGLRQHGFGTLQFASWSDTKLIKMCKEEAELFLEQ